MNNSRLERESRNAIDALIEEIEFNLIKMKFNSITIKTTVLE